MPLYEIKSEIESVLQAIDPHTYDNGSGDYGEYERVTANDWTQLRNIVNKQWLDEGDSAGKTAHKFQFQN